MDWMTVLVRFALYLDLMLVFGLPLFQLHALRKSERSSALAARFLALAAGAAVAGMALSVAGMVLMAKTMSGAADFSSLERHAVEMLLADTAFGLAWCLRMAMLALCLLAVCLPARASTLKAGAMSLAGGVALATLSWGGHGAMDEGLRGQLHLAADIVHLLAAGAWVGALAMFVLMPAWRVGGDGGDPADVSRLASLFSRALKEFAPVGTAIVGALLVSGALNYWLVVGPGMAGLWSTPYGQLLVAKLVLFGIMLALAAANRYRLSPWLERARVAGARQAALAALRTSLLIETACVCLVLALVAWLGTLGPMAP